MSCSASRIGCSRLSCFTWNRPRRKSNPLASACLDRYGWDGLAIYKACATIVFLITVTFIAFRRPKLAGGVLAVSCGLVFAVTIYSHEMIREIHRERQAFNLTLEDGR